MQKGTVKTRATSSTARDLDFTAKSRRKLSVTADALCVVFIPNFVPECDFP